MRENVVITNPPFGKKSSIPIVNEEGDADRQTLIYNRPDFWTTTSNKQLNFAPHVKSLLAIHGRAAVVVPDNVLFEGGAPRPKLLKKRPRQHRHLTFNSADFGPGILEKRNSQAPR